MVSRGDYKDYMPFNLLPLSKSPFAYNRTNDNNSQKH